MSDYEYPVTQSKIEVRILEKKNKCSHYECGHSAYKCHKCGKWKDNLNNELVAENEILKVLLAFYMPHYTYVELMESGIVDRWIKNKEDRASNRVV